jgi:tetratricopeptide (TPR) repeat protein
MKARFFVLALGLLGVSAGLMAQRDTGSDPNACLKYQTLYGEFYKQGSYADAMPWWLKAIEVCPKYSKNLYIHGEKMFREKIDKETDAKKRSVLIDSLMWVFDKRIEYFSNDPKTPRGYVLGVKGVAMQWYRKENYKASYDVLKESIKLMGSQSGAAAVLTYMQASRQLFIDGAINEEQVLNDYETTMEICDANLKLTPDDQDFILAKERIESYFTSSGAASCDALSKLYTGKFEALKGDAEWLNKVAKHLRKAGCTDAKIFIEASEALFKIEPSAESAHNIAIIFMRREEFPKAVQYLEQAITLGQQSEELADMYFELAVIKYQQLKDYRDARTLLLKAIEARPAWGKPYIILGRLYADSRDQMYSDPWDRATVFWIAVDKFIKAKTIDPEVTDEANELINAYSQYFPNNEEVFFRTLRDGDTYSVGGWINETTKVRSKKL